MQLRRLKTFTKWKDLLAFTDGKSPALSKLGLVIRERAGKRKLRIILDAKSSEVSLAAQRAERIINPRVLDAVNDALSHLAHNHKQERMG